MDGYAIIGLSNSNKKAINKACDYINEKLSMETLTALNNKFTKTVDKKIFGFKVGSTTSRDEIKARESFEDEFVRIGTAGELFSEWWVTTETQLGACVRRLGYLASADAEHYRIDCDMANALSVVIKKFGE